MAASKHWRLISVDAKGKGPLGLAALHLYAGSSRVDAAAALTCTHAPISGSVSGLQGDGSGPLVSWPRSAYCAPGWSLSWAFASEVDVTQLRVCASTDKMMWLHACDLQYKSASGVWVSGAMSFTGLKWPGVGVFASAPASTPPPAGAVLALDFATSFADMTGTHAPVAVGAVSILGGSLYNPAATGTVVKIPLASGSPLLLGASNFTIQCYIRQEGGVPGYVFNWAGGLNYAWPDLSINLAPGGGRLSIASTSSSGAPDIAYDLIPGVSRGKWTRVTLTRSGALFELRYDGVVVWAKTDARPIRATINQAGLGVGAGAWSSSGVPDEGFVGRISQFVVIRGAAVSDYLGAPWFADYGTPVLPDSAAECLHRESLGPIAIEGIRTALSARDVEFGGRGRVWGSTKIELTPGNRVPAKGRVSILRERDKLLAREVWSDPVTGAWEVGGLDIRQSFIALAQDPAGNYMPAAADRTLPEETP